MHEVQKSNILPNLPFDVSQYTKQVFTFSLPLLAPFRQLCEEQQTSLSNGLLTLFAMLLARESGESDLLLGYQHADDSMTRTINGAPASTLPLHIHAKSHLTFRSLLQRISQAMRDVPSSLITQEPLPFHMRFAGSFSQPPHLSYNLALTIDALPTELSGTIHYDATQFSRETIQGAADIYVRLFADVVADPLLVVGEYGLLTSQEQQQLLRWNATDASFPQDRCLQDLFEEQVARTPRAVAVLFEGQALRYEELNARANQVAHVLRARGVGPDTLVGLCVERSLEMVVGMLGILKAGGAYVPLDPDYPAERLAYMLDNSKITLLLTQQRLVARMPSPTPEVFCLDTGWSEIAETPTTNPQRNTTANHLAYVIYTSGSTGAPKGVMISHAAICNHMYWMQSTFPLTEHDSILQKTPFSFDASVWEFYAPLFTGAKLVMARAGGHADVQYLIATIKQMNITVLQLVPMLLSHLLEEPGFWACTSLRQVFSGGEPLSPVAVCTFAEHMHADLYNLYGPTEATIDTTIWHCQRQDDATAIPIGHAISNVQTYVLDSQLRSVPIGVAGELYIGGVGVARGYLQRPELTAEKFLPDPFNQQPGARLYRTGDQARFRSDGTIDFLGRIDQQVKIRGFRIELGEIETVLAQHPGVQECVLVARAGTLSEKQLVAYVVLSPGQTVSSADLRSYLSTTLPAYMLPAFFVTLPAFPLTPNGKIDRRALPEPTWRLDDEFGVDTRPRTPTEEILIGIWQSLLHQEQLGPSSQFFAYGGHSLLATRLIARIRQAFQVELPLQAIFTTPILADLAQAIDVAQQQGITALPPIEPGQHETPPLSFGQERLWFLDQLTPGDTTYHAPLGFRLRGPLEVEVLEASLNALLQRHAILRTTFALHDGQPIQAIAPSLVLLLPQLDLCAWPLEEREEVLQQRIQEEIAQPFDLEHGPLQRYLLLRLSEEEHVLFLLWHHSISDGWSEGVFLRELSELYTAGCAGEPSHLPPLTLQYADYALWQRQQMGEFERQLDYWREHLAGAPPLLELPTDRPRPGVQTFVGTSLTFQVPAELVEGVRQVSQREQATLYMTLLAAFQVLLARYSGQRDIVVGSPIAGRTRVELEGMIGFLVNTLALRVDLAENPAFGELLRRVREVTLQAYAHQDVPFEQVVQALQPERSLSHSPLFQVLFVLQNNELAALSLPAITSTPSPIANRISTFDLTMTLMEEGETIQGELEYNTDLFDAATMQRLIGHYLQLLTQVVRDASQPVLGIPLLTATERQQQLLDWNATEADFPPDRCLQDLFEEQVARTPQAVAVLFEGQELRYEELNARANQVAHYLQARGIGPDILVGLCVERSLEMVIGLLGILKAGGAYVPLDPTYPKERLTFLLEETQVPVLLTQQRLLERFPTYGASVVCLDRDWPEIAQQSAANLSSTVQPQNLAYVIYTSGSTGTPKGVLTAHQALVNYVEIASRAYEITSRDRVLQFASINFDASVEEIYPCLTQGATLVLRTEAMLGSARTFMQTCQQQGITCISLPTAYWHELTTQVQAGAIVLPTSLRLVIIGGETANAQHLALWQHFTQNRIRLINTYGPTEATVIATLHEVEPLGKLAGAQPTIPIGRPLANTQVYLLDAYQRLVPIGVAGEICIGGAGLAQGYLHHPEITAQRFVPHPFSQQPGARLYRTGDLARYRPDGAIEFLGRIDHQVKIRGFRIELGEIETVLRQYPGVQECVVMAREGIPGEKQLVAYVVCSPEQIVTSTDLRTHLSTKLPAYMLPAFFVMLPALPLTSTGKIDRRALSRLETAVDEDTSQGGSPRNPTEELLVTIWQTVLHQEQINTTSQFFECGGHSLLATRLIARIRQAFQVELPLQVIFTAPVLADLAHAIDAARQYGITALPTIQAVTYETPPPLSFGQERLWFLDQLTPGDTTYHVPLGFRLQGPLEVAALEHSLNALVERHAVLRTTFALRDGQPVQVIASSLFLPLSLLDLSTMPIEERETRVQQVIASEIEHPFDLEQGPLQRQLLLRLTQNEHVLLLLWHHSISDGWSEGVFLRELSDLYTAFCAGKPSPLPPVALQYADYAIWQRQQSTEFDRQRDYWREQLAGAPPLLELPTDRPRPGVQTFAGTSTAFQIPAELAQGVRWVSQREHATLYMTLLAAFQVVLARYSGQTDIVVGSPIADRTRTELEGMIGFLVNTLALRVQMEDNPSFVEVVQRVREVALQAYAHQDVPFEHVVQVLQPERDLSHSPLFQVMFILQNNERSTLSLPEITSTMLPIASQIAKFDMTIVLVEEGETIQGEIEYNTDLFDEATVERMVGQYLQVLAEGVRDATQPVLSLSLLTAGEQEQLKAWNATEADFPQDRTLHALFEEQVNRTPEAVAVLFAGQPMSYREINVRANQVAHFLQARGVGPDTLVGLCVERSFEMVIGMLGILKAGGACVPLDPDYPAERLAYMLADTRLTLLLTQHHLLTPDPTSSTPSIAAIFSNTSAAFEIVCLDADWLQIACCAVSEPVSEVTPEHLAYVVFTSGSTGRPKGVMIPHSGLANVAAAQAVQFGLHAEDRVLQAASFSFDAALSEMILAWYAGATLCLVSRELLLAGPAFQQYLRQTAISMVILTPSLLESLPWEDLPALHTIAVAGDTCSSELVETWAPGRRFFNLYGPTEMSIWSTVMRCEAGQGKPSLGHPILNTQVYVLDEALHPLPIGVAGELYIGGVGVTRGYLQRPELTAEKFLPDPFSQQPGARLYRTGDQARFRPDGTIDFLGRIDQQVKIRGFRIELGEIETVLAQYPEVLECVVIARKDAFGEKQLVAYVVLHPDQHSSSADLRGHLSTKLPAYMLPAFFVTLPAFPLTPNGKVDRLALTRAEVVVADGSQERGPRTPTEEILVTIWRNLLHQEQLGPSSQFFACGGHSLLATRLIARIRQAFQVELPLQAIFTTPILADLARVIDAARQQGITALPPITAGQSEIPPLSFGQERLWFLDRLAPGDTTYYIPFGFRLRGPLEVEVLEASLNALLQRHAILRTTFALRDGQPIQVIAPSLVLPLPQLDLRTWPLEEREEVLQQRIQEEIAQPFDLEHGPLQRALLLRLSEEEHVLFLLWHHSISDGWSVGIFLQELSELYTSGCAGEPSRLPPLTLQYADYALWERQQTGEFERQLDYWREHLAGAPPLLELPTDRPRLGGRTFVGTSLTFQVPAELVEGVRQVSQREQATLYMTLLAAFQVLLARYSGQRDIVVGSPIAGRTRVELEGMIGFLVNTLALRVQLEDNPAFVEVVQRVREASLQAYAHQDVPFEQVVQIVQPERDLSHPPLFQVMLILQNNEQGVLSLPAITSTPLSIASQVAKFDLTMTLMEEGETIQGEIEYNTDLFDAATMQRLIGHYLQLLTQVVRDASQPVLGIPLLTAAERQQQLLDWNATEADFPRDRCLQDLFEEQVARTPQAVAVLFEGQELRYEELNARANQVAHYLQARGVGPDILVGLCVERSLEIVVGLLGILKAGGAYVPLDPDYPAERLAYMLDHSKITLLLTQQRLVARMPSTTVEVFCLDTGWPKIADTPTTNPERSTTANHLAYVIYTSGSTGAPKGVMIEHISIINYLYWINNVLMAPEPLNLPFTTKPIFDPSTKQFLAPLLRGGTVFVLSDDVAIQPREVWLAIMNMQYAGLNCVPTFWDAMLQVLEDEPSLRPATLYLHRLLLGGEAINPDIIRRTRNILPNLHITNLYGPTEAAVNTTYLDYIPNTQGMPISIGFPITNMQVYVLDEQGQLSPVGVPGELYIGGIGVARGYLNRPELTAERFVPDPWSQEPGARLYRSGDRVRYLPDGRLDFLGRIDQQVKIRGFRIELGEIETVLAQHPGVLECVVIARERIPGEKQLVAYVVMSSGQSVTNADLRGHLSTKLPAYMLPTFFVILSAFPLLSNGKIDRLALARSEVTVDEDSGQGRSPRTPTEEILIGIWQSLLHQEHLDPGSQFFACGGHSLLATLLIVRIRMAFEVELPLQAIFTTPILADLAQAIDVAQQQGITALPPIEPGQHETPPLSFGQERLWFLDQLTPGDTTYHIPFGFRLHGPLEVKVLEASLNALLQRHAILRTTFAVRDGQPIQVIAPSLVLPLLLLDLSTRPVEERERLLQQRIDEEMARPFDLEHGPLQRYLLLRMSEEEHVLLLFWHHSISDGWSAGIFLRELSELYTAGCAGEAAGLPPLALQYSDYAFWQRQQAEELDRQLDYWREQLLGIPPLLELPTDRPRPGVQTFVGTSLAFQVPAELVEGMRQVSQREQATLYMTLLAAFQVLLARHSGQRDIVVGSPIAGRTRVELEEMIGFLVNTLALRVQLEDNPAFIEVVQRVREASLQAYAHQDVPFEQVVQIVQPERDLSHSPLFQVMFTLQNNEQAALSLPAITSTPLSIASQIAKCDLTMTLMEEAEAIQGELEYNTDLFDAATMQRLIGHYLQLLTQVVRDASQPVLGIPLLTATERQQQLLDWNATEADFPRDRCLQDLFEEQAARTPQAVAVLFEGQKLRYEELNARANQVAHYLRERGVGPDTLVGLCVERSLEMMIGLLGILKAGGAYVPLDPAYPAERLAYMLDHTQAILLLTQQHLIERLPNHRAEVLCLDSDWPRIAALSTTNLTSSAAPDHLAYVIYTSGSTGAPKGVMISQRSLVNLLTAFAQIFPLATNDTFVSVTTIAFDIAALELFLPLISGARVAIASRETAKDSQRLALLLTQTNAKIMQATPATWKLLLADGWPGNKQLAVLCGGEALPVNLADELKSRVKSLWNVYGPTETTIWSSGCHITPETERITIGYPLANTQLYLLDKEMQLVSIGVAGELYIGGAGLARGYFQQADITAEKFIPDPFSSILGARLYRTGDIARRRADGTLEYLGRSDQQVKIRGFRIELGEIEVVLRKHPAVRECVVVAREDTPGEKRLVAYVVLKTEHAVTIPDLRSHLGIQLPTYMLPSFFVTLPALPLTKNGKIDRRALPKPEITRSEVDEAPVMPDTLIEKQLASIWTEALGITGVSTHDNFFDVGGHSLLSIQVAQLIREQLAIEISIIDLFRYPTIEALASHLSQQQVPSSTAPYDAIREQARLQKEAMRRQQELARQRRETRGPIRNNSTR